MKAGVAEIDITPPVGCWTCGPMQPSTGVYDPLTATALVLEDADGKRVAFVGQDLLCVDWNLTEACMNKAADRAGADMVIINSSHTHSAPIYPCGLSTMREQEKALADWPERLPDLIATVVEKAASRLTPVKMSWAREPVRIGHNRRLMNAEGTDVYMLPNPDGPDVPWVDVLVAEPAEPGDNAGLPAVVFSHAAHSVIVHQASLEIGTDYPGFARKHIKSLLSDRWPQATPIFLQGCGANINAEPVAGGLKDAEAAGATLAKATVKALDSLEEIQGKQLFCHRRTVMLPTCDPPPIEEIVEKKNEEKQAFEKTRSDGRPMQVREIRDRICAMEELQKIARTGKKIDYRVELFTCRIGGDFCISAIGAEVFCEYQLWIDKNSPFKRNMVLGYCGGSDGYLASDDELALKERGGYEAGAWPCTWALSLVMPQRLAIEVGAERKIRSHFREMWSK